MSELKPYWRLRTQKTAVSVLEKERCWVVWYACLGYIKPQDSQLHSETLSKKQANKAKLAIFDVWVNEMAGESAYYASLAPLVKSPESTVLFCDLHGMCTHSCTNTLKRNKFLKRKVGWSKISKMKLFNIEHWKIAEALKMSFFSQQKILKNWH